VKKILIQTFPIIRNQNSANCNTMHIPSISIISANAITIVQYRRHNCVISNSVSTTATAASITIIMIIVVVTDYKTKNNAYYTLTKRESKKYPLPKDTSTK
jgi:hypothetical protein